MAHNNGWLPRGSALRAWVALPLILCLTGARLSVSTPPQLAVGDTEKVSFGASFIAKPGAVLLTAKVFDLDRIKVDAAFHAKVDRFEHQIDQGTELTSIMVPDKAKALTGLSSATYYCGEDLRVRSKFAELMVGDMFSKWESIVRFCFADEDKDGRLEHMIIAGAKDKERLKAVSIEPLPYTRTPVVADHESSEIRLIFRELEAATGELHLELQLWRNGQRQILDYFMCGIMRDKTFLPPSQLYPRLKNDPRKLAYPMHFPNIMGASIGVRSVDAAKQEAEFVINRPIGPALFKPVSIQYQYIFIYM